jgi:hypothetical protein
MVFVLDKRACLSNIKGILLYSLSWKKTKWWSHLEKATWCWEIWWDEFVSVSINQTPWTYTYVCLFVCVCVCVCVEEGEKCRLVASYKYLSIRQLQGTSTIRLSKFCSWWTVVRWNTLINSPCTEVIMNWGFRNPIF